MEEHMFNYAKRTICFSLQQNISSSDAGVAPRHILSFTGFYFLTSFVSKKSFCPINVCGGLLMREGEQQGQGTPSEESPNLPSVRRRTAFVTCISQPPNVHYLVYYGWEWDTTDTNLNIEHLNLWFVYIYVLFPCFSCECKESMLNWI